MECLHCGDCCLKMSPISAPEPCPNLLQNGDFYFCKIYRSRPNRCKSHTFPSRFCPIGMDILKLSYPEDIEKIRVRLEIGYIRAKEVCNKGERKLE